jgi:SAM-dependent methyltransferase
MREVGRYNIDDPAKIQGRDEVSPADRSVAAIRLNHCIEAFEGIFGPVLILGCGAGRYVRALKRSRPDLHIVGCDLSIAALEEASGLDPSGDYVALDASELPFADRSLAGVVFFDLLEHVPAYHRMLQEIHRVLNEAGVLHFYTPLENQPGSIYRLLRSSSRLPLRTWKRDHVGHINFFESEEVVRDVWNAGFEVDDIKYGFHPFGQVHDLVDYWQRERTTGSDGLIPLKYVHLVSRITFLFTWRLSYIEDRFYEGRILGSGLHLTARKLRS